MSVFKVDWDGCGFYLWLDVGGSEWMWIFEIGLGFFVMGFGVRFGLGVGFQFDLEVGVWLSMLEWVWAWMNVDCVDFKRVCRWVGSETDVC